MIGLTKEEAARIGTSLVADRQVGITNELRKLIDGGFFLSPKGFAEIRRELIHRGLQVGSGSLNVILSKQVVKIVENLKR